MVLVCVFRFFGGNVVLEIGCNSEVKRPDLNLVHNRLLIYRVFTNSVVP